MLLAIRTSVLLFFVWPMVLWAQPQSAGPSAPIWERGLERIRTLYLERETLEESALLDGVFEQLQADIPWLMVRADGDLYRLSVGSQPSFAVLSASEYDSLEKALFAVSQLVAESPGTLPPDFDPEISIMKGVSRALDRHSKLLHGERLTSFDKRLKGTLSGIGARLRIVDNRLSIQEVYENTPADRAGLLPKDRILRIDNISTLGMSLGDAVGRITGERGTDVGLLIERVEGAFSVELEMTLQRDEVRIPNVSSRVLAEGVGLVRIDHFSERTVDNLRRALRELERNGNLDGGLVIDLRNNTGGSMIQSARAADLFLSEGELVRTEGPEGRKVRGLVHRLIAQREIRDFSMPIVVLQNHRTASGAEILAGALQESGRALLIGSPTFGKGSVQKVYTLRRDARFKLTVARYLISGYREISDVGLDPDLPVGRLLLSERGLKYSLKTRKQADGLKPLFYVERGKGWVSGMEAESRDEFLVDLAKAVLEGTSSASTSDLLASATALMGKLRKEEEALLVSQMAIRGFDWESSETLSDEPLSMEASLGFVQSDVQAGESVDLEVVAWNKGNEPLSRLVAVLSSRDRVFDGLRVPLGWAGPGEEVRSTVRVRIPSGRSSRDSHVEMHVEDAAERSVNVGEFVLRYSGEGKPPLSLDLLLSGAPNEAEVQLNVKNLSAHGLEDLRIRLLHPESAGVELLQYDSSLGELSAGAEKQGVLRLKYSPSSEVLPLRVLVESKHFGRLAEWDVDLDTDGSPVHLQAPRIGALNLPTTAPAGPLTLRFDAEDDRELVSVIGYVGGEKFLYAPGGQPKMEILLDVLLEEGANSVAIRAVDNQGLERVQSWVIQGSPSSSTTDVEP